MSKEAIVWIIWILFKYEPWFNMTFVLKIGSAEMSLSLIVSKFVKSGITVIGVMIS